MAQAPGGVLVFWNLVTGTSPLVQEEPALAKLEGAGGPLVPSPEGDLLVTRGEGGRVVLLELHRHHPREADETLRVTRTREVPVLATRANLLAFSGDGRRLAVGTWAQREVRVYEVASLLTADLME